MVLSSLLSRHCWVMIRANSAEPRSLARPVRGRYEVGAATWSAGVRWMRLMFKPVVEHSWAINYSA